MRKLGLMFVIIALIAGVSVQAQKQNASIKPRESQKITIQDDNNVGYMVFDLKTGAYQCYLCEYQYAFSGTGSVKLEGCLATFSTVEKGYTITAYVNICDKGAKCFIDVRTVPGSGSDIEPMQAVLSDSNLGDSVATCETKKPFPPPIELPSEIILQNDEDGSFLYLDPATGAFKFIHCEDGGALGGVGKVTRDGVSLSFEFFAAEYRVVAAVNLADKSGKAAIDVFEPMEGMKPMQEVISDNNLSDNIAVCGPKK